MPWTQSSLIPLEMDKGAPYTSVLLSLLPVVVLDPLSWAHKTDHSRIGRGWLTVVLSYLDSLISLESGISPSSASPLQLPLLPHILFARKPLVISYCLKDQGPIFSFSFQGLPQSDLKSHRGCQLLFAVVVLNKGCHRGCLEMHGNNMVATRMGVVTGI